MMTPQAHPTATPELDWNKPLVTIRCITYNHEAYIRDALEGFVMQQTSFPFEAIVHDDASTDHTANIIREYAQKYPHIIKPILQTENQHSKGKNSRMRADINAAMSPHSQFIALCEGDDYWTDPKKLQLQADFMLSHDDVTLCFHNAMFHFEKGVNKRFVKQLDANGNPIDYPVKDDMEDRFYTFEETWNKWFHPTASWLIRRSVFSSDIYQKMVTIPTLNGDDKLRYSCAKLGRLYSFSKIMSVYRIQPSGMSQGFQESYSQSFIFNTYAIKILELGEPYQKQFKQYFDKALHNSLIVIVRRLNGWQQHLRNVKAVYKHDKVIVLTAILKFPFKYIWQHIKE